MISAFIEAIHGDQTMSNHGKFMVAAFSPQDTRMPSALPILNGAHLLGPVCGWDLQRTVLVLDLQTGEGTLFSLGGSASADLTKHQIWVCPLFEPFLNWLYQRWHEGEVFLHPTEFVLKLPRLVELPEAEFAMAGYRRPGPFGYHTRRSSRAKGGPS